MSNQLKTEINHQSIRENLLILKEKANSYDKLKDEHTLLINKYNELVLQRDEEYQHEILGLYGKNCILKEEYNNLEIAFRNNLNEFNSKIDNYKNIINSKDIEINQLYDRLNNNFHNNNNYMDNNYMNNNYMNNNNKNNNNESQIYHLYDTIELLEDEKEKLEDNISLNIAQIDDYKAELGRKDLNIQLLNDEIKELEIVSNGLEKKIDDLKTLNSNLFIRNNYLESELNRIINDDEEDEDEAISYEQECIIYDLRNKYNTLDKMYNKLKENQLQNHEENSNQSARIASLSWLLESKDIEINNYNNKINTLEQQLNKQLEQLEQLEIKNKEIDNLKINISSLENDIVELKLTNTKMEETINILGDWQVVNDIM